MFYELFMEMKFDGATIRWLREVSKDLREALKVFWWSYGAWKVHCMACGLEGISYL